MDLNEHGPLMNVTRTQIAIVRILRWGTLIASFALALYWAWTFSGLYALLSRLQLAAFGGYVDILSWSVSWAVVLFTLHFVTGALASAAGLPFGAVHLNDSDTPRPMNKFVARHFGLVVGSLLVTSGVISGACFLIDGYSAGALSDLRVEALYESEAPPTKYVNLAGRALRSDEYLVGIYYYFPMVPADWQPADEVRVVVKSLYKEPTSPNGSDANSNRVRGILRRRVDGLPLYHLRRVANVSDTAWMLDETRDPDFDRALGLGLIGGLSGVGLLFIAGSYAFGRMHPSKPHATLVVTPETDAPLPTFLKHRYRGALIFALPVIVSVVLLGSAGNVLERNRMLTGGQVDALLIVLMWLLVIGTGYVMLTPHRLGGPVGRWQDQFHAIPSWFIRLRKLFRKAPRRSTTE